MALAHLFTRAQVGIEAPLISVETHLSNGLPAFTIVGLPETAVKESRDRCNPRPGPPPAYARYGGSSEENVKFTHFKWNDGGLLSAKRKHLRVKRG